MELQPNRTGRKLVKQEEVAERLGLSVRTIERWRVTGEGPVFVRLGRRVAYQEEAIEAWINRNTFAHRAAELCSEAA